MLVDGGGEAAFEGLLLHVALGAAQAEFLDGLVLLRVGEADGGREGEVAGLVGGWAVELGGVEAEAVSEEGGVGALDHGAETLNGRVDLVGQVPLVVEHEALALSLSGG